MCKGINPKGFCSIFKPYSQIYANPSLALVPKGVVTHHSIFEE